MTDLHNLEIMAINVYRWIFWMVGWIIGTFSRLRGRKGIYQADIWTESKAVHHYEELLKKAPWDQDTRQVIDQDRLDEVRHLELWTRLLKELDQALESQIFRKLPGLPVI